MDEKIETAAEHAEAEALCRRQSAGTTVPDDEPLPEAVTKKPVGQKSPAEWAYQRLILYIKNFEKTLDDEHEIAMGFTDTGTGVLRIEGLGYFDPDIVTFYGTDQTAARVQLVQHVSQLNVLLRAMPKAKNTEKPRRIGFELAKALDE
ncbi:MAG: hypothetical protein EX266_17570, partial [Rhodobacteraceae bacterium]